MKKDGFRQWLETQKYVAQTISAQMYRAARVEEFHGDIDAHFAKDRMAGLIGVLSYSKDDERHNRPEPKQNSIRWRHPQ